MWLDNQIEIEIEGSNSESFDASVTLALAALSSKRVWESEARTIAVDKLLDLKNSTWLEEEEAPLSREALLGNLELSSLKFWPDGSSDTYFLIGDVFWGHGVVVSRGGEEPDSANLYG